MIKSMTGYGKGEAVLQAGKLTIEIKTLNGKQCDVNLKSSLLPKDKELGVRARVAEALQRGTIDIFLSWEANSAENAKQINMDVARGYIRQASELASEMGSPNIGFTKEGASNILNAVLRMPDVVDSKKQDIITDENWPLVSEALEAALSQCNAYREHEGISLYNDVTGRVRNILEIYKEVEAFEPERVEGVRNRLSKAIADLQVSPNPERFEQELIFYLEKYDINEEKVRLRQHCQYFFDTIDGEPMPGKKLGFIIQEMGREINTTGSKANHAGIQQAVVRMKDELEKVREQSMNIL